MQNSMVMFTFFVVSRKYPVWDNLVQKLKTVALRWNLIPRLIRICWIQWCCSLFSFLTGNALLGQIWSKLSIFTGFFVSDKNALFGENLVQNFKIVSLRLNLLASLIRICRIQRRCSLFCFQLETPFLGQMWSKMSKLSA